MDADGEGVTERPRCRCHDRPMHRDRSTRGGWRCAAKDDYRRTRRCLRQRIALKRELIAQLEARLEEENAG
jgi:hypothetical protein